MLMCRCSASRRSADILSFFSSFIPLIACAVIAFVVVFPLATWGSTGYTNEITNIAVQNVTPTTVDIVWDTLHLSTSQVVLARDKNYQGERRIPVNPDPALVNHHRVTVDRLMPYDASQYQGTYYFYVASQDVNGATSTAPGPYDSITGDPKTFLLGFNTAAPDVAKPSDFTIYTYGPTNVYAGSDLYFGMQVAQLAGSRPNIYVRNMSGYNNGSDGSVRGVIAMGGRALNPQTISVHFACFEYNPANSDAYDQSYDAAKNMGFCWPSQYYMFAVRVRTNAQTAPGRYAVNVILQDNGKDVSSTYYFTVLPPATAPLARSTYASPIPGKYVWESYMLQLGHKYCDDQSYSASRDRLNAAGTFLTGWGWQGDAWFYDGGRVYQQLASYTNDPKWNHCALTILDPYRQWILNNNAAMQLYSVFPYGMTMNYWRTGDNSNAAAIQALATKGGGANYGGWVDPYMIRETAYITDVRIANEMITSQRDRLLAKGIDKLLGHLDMLNNGQVGPVHPFMIGLAMETAIHYYDMTVAEGKPDNRIPAVVKKALDALWRDYYVPSTHAFRYTRWDIPTIDTWTVLNDLVAPAYAWYWSRTGDADSLTRGDDLFQHEFDVPGDVTWCGKEFSQIYKWSFDYIRWRSGQGTSTTAKENNPFVGPYADTEPPIQWQVTAGNITDTTATITWRTYENADSQIIYGPSKGYYPSSSPLLDGGGAMKQTHTVTLTGLKAGTTYHYRVNSRDAAANLASLGDATFTTTGTPGGGGGGIIGGGTGTGSGNDLSIGGSTVGGKTTTSTALTTITSSLSGTAATGQSSKLATSGKMILSQ